MQFSCKNLLTVSVLSIFTFLTQGAVADQHQDDVAVKFPPVTSPFVIPPGTPVNYYNLLMNVGQDDELSKSAITLFTESGFRDFLGWDQAKIDAYRGTAMAWFTERFGLDFTGYTYDPTTGTVTTSWGLMVPYRYQGYFRVLSSNNFAVPPYTPITPSSDCLSQYTLVFFGVPTYTGTYGNQTPIVGNASDSLSYGVHRIFLNYSATNYKTFFARNYYPGNVIPQTPVTPRARYVDQMYSPDFGPGIAFISEASFQYTNQQNFDELVLATWSFPGSFVDACTDWNGFDAAPVAP